MKSLLHAWWAAVKEYYKARLFTKGQFDRQNLEQNNPSGQDFGYNSRDGWRGVYFSKIAHRLHMKSAYSTMAFIPLFHKTSMLGL